MHIENKVFLITGGASGLGAAAAKALVDAGAKVLLVDINAELLEHTAAALGQSARGVVCDITNEEQAQAAVNAAREHFGALHGVINCAGVGSGEKVLGRKGAHGLASFSRVVAINLIGSFNMLRLGAELMAQNMPNVNGERGVIINTASIAGYEGQIGQIAYAASKGGVIGMTLPAARDLASYGIRVVTIAPGLFETPLMTGLSDEVLQALSADVPFPPRLGRPSEYAALVRHIVENSMLNGETIRLDGALRMAPK